MKNFLFGITIAWLLPVLSWRIASGEFSKCVDAGVEPYYVSSCARTNSPNLMKLADILNYNPIRELEEVIQ